MWVFTRTVGQFLNDVDLSCIYLSGVDLRGADLRNTDLCGTYLGGANLVYADLGDANLSDADLSGADLSNSYLNGANFTYTVLCGTNFSDSELHDTNFCDADLSGANFSYASLGYAYFYGTDLSRVDFNDADLYSANLTDANLRGADLRGANFDSADFSSSDLSDVTWDETTNWSNAIALNTAINIDPELKQTPNFKAAFLLCDGYDLVVSGKVDDAISAYTEAQNLDPNIEISTYFWYGLGFFGSLHNMAANVLFACEKLLELERSARHQDIRGLARSLTGNFADAIEDFEAAINSGQLKGEILEKRKRWLEALKSGINPFTPEELEALRASEGQRPN